MLKKTANLSVEQLKFLPELLEILVKKHQQQATFTSIQDWLYEVNWIAVPSDVETEQRENSTYEFGTWLILADRGGTGEILAKRLQNQGHNCLLVYAGDNYQNQGNGIWSIKPTNPLDFEHLLREVRATNQLQIQGVIYLWSLDIELEDKLTISALEQAQRLSCGGTLHLVQSLAQSIVQQTWLERNSSIPRLWLVTRGAMPVGVSPPALAQAPLWGLGKVVSLEYPQIWGGMLDLSPEKTADDASLLLSKILPKILPKIENSQGEDHLAFRQGQWYAARLVPSQPQESQIISLRVDASYLITGGLGSLGLQVAQWLGEQGAKYLVLIGRNEASSQAQAAINRIEQAGVKVLVVRADVSEQGDIVQVLEQIKQLLPPLRGVIHAAGVPGLKFIPDIEFDEFESVLRPKVLGSWILSNLTQGMDLDFFVNFSSIASVWGSKGQAHYAAANHFLDVLAHYRHRLGLPALTVNWGPWDGGGMTGVEIQTLLTKMGVLGLPPHSAIAALEYLLGTGCTQATVANVDWNILKKLYEVKERRLLEKISAKSQELSQQQPPQQSEFLQKLETVQLSERRKILMTHIQSEVSKVLGLDISTLLRTQRGFFEMGMDSLTALELKDRLEISFGISLPATLAFEFSTVNDLTEYLAKEVLGLELPSSDKENEKHTEHEIAKTEITKTLSEIEMLTEDEIETSIIQELAELETVLKQN